MNDSEFRDKSQTVAQGDSGGTSGSPSRKDENGSSNGAD